jgi:hypothetical protein
MHRTRYILRKRPIFLKHVGEGEGDNLQCRMQIQIIKNVAVMPNLNCNQFIFLCQTLIWYDGLSARTELFMNK